MHLSLSIKWCKGHHYGKPFGCYSKERCQTCWCLWHGRVGSVCLRDGKEMPQRQRKREKGARNSPADSKIRQDAVGWGTTGACSDTSLERSCCRWLSCKTPAYGISHSGARIIRGAVLCWSQSPSPIPCCCSRAGICFNLSFSLPNLFQCSINYISFLRGGSVFPTTVTVKWAPCIYLILWAFSCSCSPSSWGGAVSAAGWAGSSRGTRSHTVKTVEAAKCCSAGAVDPHTHCCQGCLLSATPGNVSVAALLRE